MSEAARGSGEIARNIVGVAKWAQQTSTGASVTHDQAKSLAALSDALTKLAGEFKIS